MGRTVYVVESDSKVRRSLGHVLQSAGYSPRPYLTGQDFTDDMLHLEEACVLLQQHMPDIAGLSVLESLDASRMNLPVIMMVRHNEISIAVRAMKLGASNVLETPFEDTLLLAAIAAGFAEIDRCAPLFAKRQKAERIFSRLSDRERAVLNLLADGKSNKETAIMLGLSVRTVEMNRAALFAQLGLRTLPEAMKLARTAGIPLRSSNSPSASAGGYAGSWAVKA